MHGVPAADSATRKRTVSFLRRTSTWGCKVRNEIRDKTVERTHVQLTRGHLRIDRSYTIYIHITVHRHSPWNGVYLDSTGVFPVDAFHPLLFSFFPPFSYSFLFLVRLEKNHARGMHSRRANCARARRRFSQIRFFNANVTLTPSSDNSIQIILNAFSLCDNNSSYYKNSLSTNICEEYILNNNSFHSN